MTDKSSAPAPPQMEFDPDKLENQKRVRRLRLNLVQIPLLRLVGFTMMTVLVYVHNTVLLEDLPFGYTLRFGALALAYTAVSTVVLRIGYERYPQLRLDIGLLTLDIFIIAMAVYFSGGNHSWLFFLLMLRVADQANTRFNRVLLLGHLSALAYLALMLFLQFGEGRVIDWAVEGCKAAIIYIPAMYVALAARTSEQRRKQTREVLSVSMDLITELRQSRRQLVKERIRAEAGAQAKSEFLANMSHEIRTPLNGIIGMNELALGTDLSAEQREYLDIVNACAQSLLDVVNDVLDYSKIDAGQLRLECLDFDVRETVGQAIKTMAHRASERGLELLLRVDPQVPTFLHGDPSRIRQILFNLISNGIKFTDRGEVVVDVALETVRAKRVVLLIKVRDTGIGIPESRQEEIFKAFRQVDGSITRRYGGTGLGLSICSELVHRMGGRIWVDSQLGKGSTFSFDLSLGPAMTPADAIPVVDARELSGLRALVVDDNETSCRILEELLSHWGLIVTSADSANEALATLRDGAQAKKPFDLVVIDAVMPGGDGYALARRINNRFGRHTFNMVMLTAAGVQGDESRCEALGVGGLLAKPVTEAELSNVLAVALGHTSDKSQHITRHAIHEVESSLRILLAEDNPVNQKLAKTLLEKRGHSVVIVHDGIGALEKVEEEEFDVVLMDLQMPEMGGLEASLNIRRRERRTGGHLPIIALTAHAMEEHKARSRRAGMDAYITKPIRSRELFEVVESVALLGEPRPAELSAREQRRSSASFPRMRSRPRVEPIGHANEPPIQKDTPLRRLSEAVIAAGRNPTPDPDWADSNLPGAHRAAPNLSDAQSLEFLDSDGLGEEVLDLEELGQAALESGLGVSPEDLAQKELGDAVQQPLDRSFDPASMVRPVTESKLVLPPRGVDSITESYPPRRLSEEVSSEASASVMAAPGQNDEPELANDDEPHTLVIEPFVFDLIDRPTVLRNLMNDEALLLELADVFFEDYGSRLAEVRNAFVAGDVSSVARAAHALKGLIGTFTTEGPFKVARALDSLSPATPMSEVGRLVSDLEYGVELLKVEIASLKTVNPEAQSTT